jgi:hypothetical protein
MSKAIVLVLMILLVLCGTTCVLTSLVMVIVFYHLHSGQFNESRDAMWFAIFAGLPALGVFVVGAVMAAVGIKIGQRESDRQSIT